MHVVQCCRLSSPVGDFWDEMRGDDVRLRNLLGLLGMFQLISKGSTSTAKDNIYKLERKKKQNSNLRDSLVMLLSSAMI